MGVGLHLLSLAYAGTVAHASLAGMTDPTNIRDLDEARRLITALAGLVTASAEYLGPHAGPMRDGLKTLQLAFRESSAAPDEPGHGPGEKYTGPVW